MECVLGGLLDAIRRTAASLPDPSRGSDERYALTDAAAYAPWVFFIRAPSLLEFQRRMQEVTSCSDRHMLFGVEAIPCDHRIRNLLDGVSPDRFAELFPLCLDTVREHGALARSRAATVPRSTGPR